MKFRLKADFDGVAISQQNLSEYNRHGFRDWQARQKAIEFALTLKADDSALQSILPSDLAEKLSRWVAVRYAAATRALSTTDPDLDKELRHLRHFCLLILALRRGEVNAGRLAVEQQRLAIELAHDEEAKEKEFWDQAPRHPGQTLSKPRPGPNPARRRQNARSGTARSPARR